MHRLFGTGEYSLGSVVPSVAPSMDIQVASNFERLLYFLVDREEKKVREVMQAFRTEGKFSFDDFFPRGFSSSSMKDEEIPQIIKSVWKKHKYLIDPHTACAFKNLDPSRPTVILATAHPAKFPSVYEKAELPTPKSFALELLLERTPRKFQVGAEVPSIRSFIDQKIS